MVSYTYLEVCAENLIWKTPFVSLNIYGIYIPAVLSYATKLNFVLIVG